MITFSCPQCSFVLEFGDEAGGVSARCPKCRVPVVVPQVTALPAEEAMALVRHIAEKHQAKGTLRRLGNIPPEHIANAAARFAIGMGKDEIPLLLIDSSLMQNGKSGLLLTNRNLYSSRLTYAIPLADIHKAAFEKRPIRIWLLVILVCTFLIALFRSRIELPLFEIDFLTFRINIYTSNIQLLMSRIDLWMSLMAIVFYVIALMLQWRELRVNEECVFRAKRLHVGFWEELLPALASAARSQRISESAAGTIPPNT